MAEYEGTQDASHHASSSRLPQATPTKRAKRIEQRKSYSYSPYPKGSPRTPARRAIGESSLIHSPRSQPRTPQSPGMRAITSIISLISPFGSRQARSSAAFGEADLSATAERDDEDDQQQQEEQTTQIDETIDDSMDQTMDEPKQQSIYPALPSRDMKQSAFASTSTHAIEPSPKHQSRRSPFYQSAPKHSTPTKSAFGAFASSATHQVIPPSASAFTFGDGISQSNAPSLPSYPRSAARSKLTSPLSKNYDLLARFFAEKAQQSTIEDDAPSAASLADGEPGGEEAGLTEIEVAGCMRLIEESLAQGRAGELDRLRGDAIENASLRAGTPRYLGDATYNRGYMSRSPSLPLGAAAGEMTGTFGLRPRPSSSFLSPSLQNDDARINRSLATTFGSNSVPAKRRHRPLYLGPGQGAGAASSLLRRNQQLQQQRKTLASRTQQSISFPTKPIWQRGEVDQEDRDASGSNVKRQRREVPEDSIPQTPQPRSLSSSQSLPAFTSNTATPSFASPPTPEPSVPDDDEPVYAPPRTATAEAMLSILSSGPSIPVRKVVPPKVSAATEDEEDTPAARPEIVNPYQTRSRLSKRTSAATSASSLAAKEKERLKEEREKRQRLNQEAKTKPLETAPNVTEVTDSTQASRRGTRRNKLQEDEQKKREADSQRKEEQRKEADANKKKLEEEEAERERKAEADEAEKRREQERERKTELVKKKMEELASNSAATDSSSSTAPASEAPAAPPATSNGPRKSFAFGSSFAPKKPSPLSQANIITPDSPSSSSEASERDNVKPFSFLSSPGVESQSAPAATVKITASPSVTDQEKSPREQALAATATSLPKFDFTVDFMSSPKVTVGDESAITAAKEKEVVQLPMFQLFGADKDEEASVKNINSTPPAFPFAPSTGTSMASKESSVEPSTSASEPEPEAKSADSSASALLSGQGEGEENEDCLHEVRSKLWTLKDGKWADLGIGLFKIKKNNSDGKKRILVRNAGNGKVMLNFRLRETFKPSQDKTVITFTGFDGEGKPANYRCRVKTEDSASELASALQREAIS